MIKFYLLIVKISQSNTKWGNKSTPTTNSVLKNKNLMKITKVKLPDHQSLLKSCFIIIDSNFALEPFKGKVWLQDSFW